MKIYLIFVVFIFLTSSNSQTFSIFKHQILSQATGPRCLDGSPSAFYIDVGLQSDKFVIFFEGGGLCRGDGLNGMLDYCLQRSTTNLGSSKNYPEKASFDQYVFLNSDQRINPIFYTWTRVFVPYCDGSLHQGFKSNSVSYKGKKLYFRGQNNTKAHLQYLDKNFKFYNASKMVISGTSAGAMATFGWGNYIYNQAINKESVYLMPDSGIFLSEFVNPWTNKTMQYYTSSLFQLVFAQTKLPSSQCSDRYSDVQQCFQAGNLHDLLKPKTLIIQSSYDAWGLEQILGLRCLTHPSPSSIQSCTDQQRVYIEKYHDGLQKSIANFTQEHRHGIWSIGCVQHGFVDIQTSYRNTKYLTPYPNGITLFEAVTRFLNGQKINQIDQSIWPQNKGCSGLNQNNFLRKAQISLTSN